MSNFKKMYEIGFDAFRFDFTRAGNDTMFETYVNELISRILEDLNITNTSVQCFCRLDSHGCFRIHLQVEEGDINERTRL